MISKIIENKFAQITTILTFVGSVVLGVFFIDDRYAHAADLEKSVASIRIENKQMRKQVLEDKVFEIQLKGVKGTIEQAQLERAKQQIKEIENEIRQIQSDKR